MTRRGMTLAELLVALVLAAMLAAMTAAMVLRTTRSATRARGALLAARATQTTFAVLRHDLRDAASADLTVVPSGIAFPRPVGDGLVCDVAGAVATVAREAWSGERLPEAGRDRVATLPDPALPWSAAVVTGSAPASCPDGAPGWRITPVAGGRVLRITEPAVLRAYTVDGLDWLGLLPGGGGSVQPFAGPFRGGSLRLLPGAATFAVEFTPLGDARAVRLEWPVAGP